MSSDARRAIAYVKGTVLPDDPAPVMRLRGDDALIDSGLCDGLIVLYAIDRGGSFDLVQQRHLCEAGLSAKELHELAVENLRRLVWERVVVEQRGEAFTATVGGNFEASLLLLDEFWDPGVAAHVGKQPVVAVPTRDVIAFCAHDSASGRSALRDVIERVWEVGDHRVSRALFQRVDLRWHRLAERLRE